MKDSVTLIAVCAEVEAGKVQSFPHAGAEVDTCIFMHQVQYIGVRVWESLLVFIQPTVKPLFWTQSATKDPSCPVNDQHTVMLLLCGSLAFFH